MGNLTRAQQRLIDAARIGPVERPRGFGAGTAAWDLMLCKLTAQDLVELSPADADGRVWATITDRGADLKVRHYQKEALVAEIPNGLERLEAMLRRNREQNAVKKGDDPGSERK